MKERGARRGVRACEYEGGGARTADAGRAVCDVLTWATVVG